MIKSLSCVGYRSFSTKQKLDLAMPNGKLGSGLTVLVGPNGGGKSTLVECFNKISSAKRNVSFSRGRRNLSAGDKVIIEVDCDGVSHTLQTIKGGSETSWDGEDPPKIYYLPSRRFFSPYFSSSKWNRETYLKNQPILQFRSNSLDSYTSRLIEWNKSESKVFDEMLSRIIGKKLEWTIDQEDSGQYIVNFTRNNGLHHNSDGMGEGIISLMFIVDALCGSTEEVVVIDEPELSLHPQLQIRLMKEILEKTKDSQVVISTHNPNMLSLESIINGGVVARVFDSGKGAEVKTIDERSRKFIDSISRDKNNPHIMGIDARSCFFAEDCLIITEGQEDVILYPVILDALGFSTTLPFFGFGAGGASGIKEVAHLLYRLGFKKVGAIYDGDKKKEFEAFKKEYDAIGYKSWIIPADDIRDKEKYEAPSKIGLLEKDRKTLKTEYVEGLKGMFEEINKYLVQNAPESL